MTVRVIARYFVVVLCLFVCLFVASVPVSSGVAGFGSSGWSRTNHYDATEELRVLLEAAGGHQRGLCPQKGVYICACERVCLRGIL